MAEGEQRSAARKAQIFDAAATVFARKGYHGARMDDIVKESGLSKGALYWYFKSKEELATGLVHQMLAAESQAMDALMTDARPASARLEGLLRGFGREVAKDPQRAPLALELLSLARTVPGIRECFSTHHEHYVDRVRELLLEVCAGERRASEGDVQRAEAAAIALASVIDGLVLRWTLAATPFDLEQRLWEAAEVIVRGAQQGRE